MAGLPAPPANARNVVLIVWDTVSAYNLSPHGYPRDTAPNLSLWARQGSPIQSGAGAGALDIPLA